MFSLAIVSPLAELVRRVQGGEAVVMTGQSWSVYRALLRELDGLRVRTTFEHGRLEIMPTSRLHEIVKSLLARLLEAWAEAQGIPYSFGGEMTCEREDLDRGLQPDECYWIAHEAQVRGKTDLDFAIDPPPDLVLEIEISRTILDRLAILAKLGVREVWRCDGQSLRIGILQSNGDYLWGQTSLSFPGLPVSEIVQCLQQIGTLDHGSIVRNFRASLRQPGRGTGSASN